MSQIPKYTGQWVDWDHNQALGDTITLSVRHTLFLIGATTILVTFVTGSLWHIIAFLLHRRLATRPATDPVTLQHRLIFRNDPAATAALKHAFQVYWTWKPWECCGKRNDRRRLFARRDKRAGHVFSRTLIIVGPALLLFAGLTAAGIFVGNIAHDANELNFVLVKPGYDQGHCGITTFRNIPLARESLDEKGANDTRAAIAYARSCYRQVNGVLNSAACSRYVTQSLPYSPDGTECPFSPKGEAFQNSICNFNGVQQAHRLSTPALDSHTHFGINAPKENRVQLLKETICSPLRIEGFTSRAEATGSRQAQNTTVTDYNYGSVSGVSNYTYEYNTAAINDIIPFQVTALTAKAGIPNGWAPIKQLERTDADVTIVFIAPNSVRYRAPSNDPVFRSQYCIPHDYGDGQPYSDCDPYNAVSVIGCTERYALCNDNLATDKCTRPGGQQELLNLSRTLSFNTAQNVTATRLIYMIQDGNTFTSIDGIGSESLQISNRVFNFFAPGAAENQWQVEVKGWMETTLAKWQAHVVEFAINTADPGPAGKIGFPITNPALQEEWKHQCANQKVANLGEYQNISVFGLALTWTVSLLIIILALSLEGTVSVLRKWRKTGTKMGTRERRIAWNVDGLFQQQRIALRSAGYTSLVGGGSDVPYLDVESQAPLPIEATEATLDGRSKPDTLYKTTDHGQSLANGTAGGQNGASTLSSSSPEISHQSRTSDHDGASSAHVVSPESSENAPESHESQNAMLEEQQNVSHSNETHAHPVTDASNAKRRTDLPQVQT